MMNKASGNIKAVRSDRMAFLLDDEKWYNMPSKPKRTPVEAEKGDYVEFQYTVNGDWNNVKGSVAPATAPASKPTTAFSSGPAKVAGKTFPVDALHPDRSIIRQNSLAHALNVLEARCYEGASCQEYAEAAIEVARIFEAYSAGDLDRAIVEAEVKMMLAREVN